MPTKKPRKDLVFEVEDLHEMHALWLELRAPHRRGTESYIGLGETFNQWLARCAVERTALLRKELGIPRPRRGR